MGVFLTYTGWAMTAASLGGLNVYQWIKSFADGTAWPYRARHIEGVRIGLQQLRMMLTEAEKTGEIIKTEEVRAFVRTIGHSLLEKETNLVLILSADAPKPPRKWKFWR